MSAFDLRCAYGGTTLLRRVNRAGSSHWKFELGGAERTNLFDSKELRRLASRLLKEL